MVPLGLVCLLFFVPPLHASEPPSVFLEDLTWTELRDAIRSGKTTVIIPIGGTEQNGPGITLGKHNGRARVLSGMIAQSLGNALVAPVIAYVPEGNLSSPTAHMRFPGTITVPDAAFETILEYAARSMKQAGFRNIVILGDHGGYQQDLKSVAGRLNREWTGTPERAIAVEEYYRASTDGFEAILKARGYTAAETGKHAGLMDTSLQLALAPETVRTTNVRSNADGVEGDPRRASAELGRLGVQEIVAATVAAIRKEAAPH